MRYHYQQRKKRDSRVYLLCSLFLIFSACTQPLYRDKFVILGTYLEVISPYKQAGEIVYQEFIRLDKVFNLYNPNSEISRLNHTNNQSFSASPELIEVIELAKRVYKLTEGGFDISSGRIYSLWKDLIKKGEAEEFPSLEKIKELKKYTGMDYIEVDNKKKVITIKKKGIKIDLSGIAKGYIVDKAVIALKKKGVKSALINAGGDIYCLGKNRTTLWKVGVRNPQLSTEIVDTLSIVDEAVATSGNYEQFFEFKGKKYSHLINPKTGFPVKNNLLSVTVVANTCALADSLATGLFIMGLEGIKKVTSKGISEIKKVIAITKNNHSVEVKYFP
ncbi:MAG: hypothetical protein B6D56_01990 [Candidatus Omnitrophica bacterium 4484_70.1]|nr:MAG: hypothetical protein B6D56_01990 [Candidatus Omnitrophica bacterium 4484_70.1]